MSTRGRGPFDNDDAADWARDFVDAPDFSVLIDTIGEVADLSDVEPLEIAPACRAIAAVETVAACLDGSTGALPEAVRGWVASGPGAVPNHLSRKAGRALERVLRDSELRDEWSRRPDHSEWVQGIERMRARLPF